MRGQRSAEVAKLAARKDTGVRTGATGRGHRAELETLSVETGPGRSAALWVVVAERSHRARET